jgi:intermediate cleaving peptidase 55
MGQQSSVLTRAVGLQNALSIHYTRNDSAMRPDSLVLVDAGGQHGGYAADVTRTWPNARRFTAAQRDLYEAVLGAQRTCVSLCRADSGLSLDRLHTVAEQALHRAVVALGFDVRPNVCCLLLNPPGEMV